MQIKFILLFRIQVEYHTDKSAQELNNTAFYCTPPGIAAYSDWVLLI